MLEFPKDLKRDERGLATDVDQLRELVHTLSNIAFKLIAPNMMEVVLALGLSDTRSLIGYIMEAHECTCTGDKETEKGVDLRWLSPIPPQALN